jgi:uncharacterized protein (TIGR02145 family)
MNINLPPILDFNYETNKGTMFDTRDGQSYPVVKIGSQIWLAENFRYLPSKEKGDPYENSMIPDNSYLDKGYGRLYDWNTALYISPDGWRLPSIEDFQELRDFIKKDNNLVPKLHAYQSNMSSLSISKYLISNKSGGTYNGNDKYGFNAKFAGYFNISQIYLKVSPQGLGYEANFWTCNKDKPIFAELFDTLGFFNDEEEFQPHKGHPLNHLFSVRLIKNQ